MKYLVSRQPVSDPDHGQVYQASLDPFRPPVRVYERKTVLPRAYLVATAKTPEQDKPVLAALCALDPKAGVLVEGEALAGEAPFTPVNIHRRSPGEFTVALEAPPAGVLVVSETWHTDWRAEVDGKRVVVRRANHGQLALPVAGGTHQVRVYYYPWDFYLGCLIASVALGAVALSIALLHMRTRRLGKVILVT